jgi:hypothetical protein
MVDFFQKIVQDQGSVEDLVRKIPGFKGYFEKQDRRAADRLLREHLVKGFEQQLEEFGRLQRELVASGGLKYMERVQTIDTKMRTFIDRIESAPQGYAGLFDAIKVREEALARVYAFDYALLAYQDQLAQGLSALEDSLGGESVEAVLKQLDKVVREASKALDKRSEVMQGLSEGGESQ